MAARRGFGRLGVLVSFVALLVVGACLVVFWFRFSDANEYRENTDAAVAQHVEELRRGGSTPQEVEAAQIKYRSVRDAVTIFKEEQAALSLYAAAAALAVFVLAYPFCWLIGWTISGFGSKE